MIKNILITVLSFVVLIVITSCKKNIADNSPDVYVAGHEKNAAGAFVAKY